MFVTPHAGTRVAGALADGAMMDTFEYRLLATLIAAAHRDRGADAADASASAFLVAALALAEHQLGVEACALEFNNWLRTAHPPGA